MPEDLVASVREFMAQRGYTFQQQVSVGDTYFALNFALPTNKSWMDAYTDTLELMGQAPDNLRFGGWTEDQRSFNIMFSSKK